MTSKPGVARVKPKKPSFTGKPYQRSLFANGRGPKLKPEEVVQISIVEWLNMVAPQLIVIHIPNEGDRSSVTKIINARKGFRAGATDLVLLGTGFCAWVEVKVKGEYPKPHQRQFMRDVESLGFPTAVVRSIEDARNFLAAHGIRTREHLFPTQEQLL